MTRTLDGPDPRVRLCISCGHMHTIPLRPGPTARALVLVVSLVAIGLFFVACTAWGNGWRP